MRRTHSYSKRELLDRCLRQYFYEYYAAAKKLPFDESRKGAVQGQKGFSGVYLLGGEKLHWAIHLFLTRGDQSRDWARHTALASFDDAVRYSRDPKANAGMLARQYPPSMLLEFYYGDPRADELAVKVRDSLATGMDRFLTDEAVTAVWRPILAGEHYVEQRLSKLPKFDDFGIDGQIDLIGRDAQGVHVVDWKSGVKAGGHDSLQLLIYGVWAGVRFGVSPEQVRVQRVFLGDGTVEAPCQLDAGLVRAGKARLLQDIELMKELDPYGRAGDEEAFTPCQRENVCRQCKYQGVCPDARSGPASKPTSTSLTVLRCAP
jgi:hypothetical protein